MLICADWVLTGSRAIKDGALIVDGSRIEAVGEVDTLSSRFDGERIHLPGCTISPGLVNAHTHLSLTALGGLLPAGDFERWLSRIVPALHSWDEADYSASAVVGAAECLKAGVTVVGDIAYGPDAVRACADAGLGGVVYCEVLGIPKDRLFAELERVRFTPGCEPYSHRLRCGLSPHSAYTSGPDLLQAVHTHAAEMKAPIVIHVAESRAEVELVADGTGPLAAVAARNAEGFSPTGDSPVGYLDRLGVLDAATVIHLCELDPTDVARLASTVRGAVTCPRSNAFLGNRMPPVRRLAEHGIPVGIGTDSSASNTDLDLMEEVRALRAADRRLTDEQLFAMVTAAGAIALGVEDRFGSLEPGMQADIAVFRLDQSLDPFGDFVSRAGTDTLEAVMSAGTWRVRDGRLTNPAAFDAASARAAHAAQKASAALDA